MTDDEVVEAMKDAMYDTGAYRVTVVRSTGRDTWRTITVREPGSFEENDDGYAVDIEDGGL
jgi:hypothetical protein